MNSNTFYCLLILVGMGGMLVLIAWRISKAYVKYDPLLREFTPEGIRQMERDYKRWMEEGTLEARMQEEEFAFQEN